MNGRGGRRAMQMDDTGYGGILETDEPDEAPENEPCDPDGDGDDDCNPAGDTDNSHWSADGMQIKALPGMPLVPVDGGKEVSSARRRRAAAARGDDECEGCPEHRWSGPVASEKRWNGPAAMSGCANSDTPASCYSAICAGKRAGDTALQSTWALPHHAHPGAPPDLDGVRNALARLSTTQGLTNATAAKAHLERHLAELNGGDSKNSAPAYGMERRYLPLNLRGLQIETRSDGQATISGYSAVFGQMSQNLGFFREVVEPGTFRDTIASDDVVALFNHDPNFPLGGTRDGRLKLNEDDHGLFMTVQPTSTGYARDLVENIRQGVVRQQSFGFETRADDWDDSGDVPVRHLRAVKLSDVSPVVFPAYTQTDVQVRQMLERAGLEYRGVCMAVTTAFRGLELDRIDRRILTTALERVPMLRHAFGQAAGASASQAPVPQAWMVALTNRRAELDARISRPSPRKRF